MPRRPLCDGRMQGFCQQRYNALADNTRKKSLGSWVPGFTLDLAPPSLLEAIEAEAPFGPQVLAFAREAMALG
jgi:hypothetical protein